MRPKEQILSELHDILILNNLRKMSFSTENTFGAFLCDKNLPWFEDVHPPARSDTPSNLHDLSKSHGAQFLGMASLMELEWCMFWCTFSTWYNHPFYYRQTSDLNNSFRWDGTVQRSLFERAWEGSH